LKDNKNALEYFEKSLVLRRNLDGENHPEFANCLYSIGNSYYNMNDHQRALEYYEKCLGIGIKLYGENDANVA
jgi:tetratricopeptide (TPR) repeat protein